ncbi:hypothetical protein MY10362_003813 [Beauveria mimosiformis]
MADLELGNLAVHAGFAPFAPGNNSDSKNNSSSSSSSSSNSDGTDDGDSGSGLENQARAITSGSRVCSSTSITTTRSN